jgi:hypothetical protein
MRSSREAPGGVLVVLVADREGQDEDALVSALAGGVLGAPEGQTGRARLDARRVLRRAATAGSYLGSMA